MWEQSKRKVVNALVDAIAAFICSCYVETVMRKLAKIKE